jgi:predicted dehydrogenase
MTRISAALGILLVPLIAHAAEAGKPAKTIRAGIIGLDTSHVIAFTKLLNNAKPDETGAAVRVVAAFPGGSADIPASANRVEGFTKQIREMDVEIVNSIPTLLEKVDVVLLESVDGRPHLEQARPVIKAGKPLFIDKPLAGSLADCIAIAELARKHNVAWFSSSSLRFSPGVQAMRTGKNDKVGQVVGCDAWGPCSLEEHHPDLFWYGIHGVEILFTIMGTGIDTVSRTQTTGTELVVGTWKDGRVGTFRGIRLPGKGDYGAMVFGKTGIADAGKYGGYEPLVMEITRFFKTGKPPVAPEETIEIFAFMEAADESKRQGGAPVKIAAVMAKAAQQAKLKLGE